MKAGVWLRVVGQRSKAPKTDYESEGRTIESFRARHSPPNPSFPAVSYAGPRRKKFVPAATPARRQSAAATMNSAMLAANVAISGQDITLPRMASPCCLATAVRAAEIAPTAALTATRPAKNRLGPIENDLGHRVRQNAPWLSGRSASYQRRERLQSLPRVPVVHQGGGDFGCCVGLSIGAET
jgi:hypothetical protein